MAETSGPSRLHQQAEHNAASGAAERARGGEATGRAATPSSAYPAASRAFFGPGRAIIGNMLMSLLASETVVSCGISRRRGCWCWRLTRRTMT